MSSRRLYALISIFVIPSILMGCARDEAARTDQTFPGKELITSPPHKVYPFEPSPEKFQQYMNSRTWRGGSTRVTFMYLQDCKEITEYRIPLDHTFDAPILKYAGSYGYECNDGFARITDPTGTDTCEVIVEYKPVIKNTFYRMEYEIWSKKNPRPRRDENRWSYEENFNAYQDPDLEKQIETDYQERLSHWKSRQYWLVDEKLQKILPHIERWEYSFDCQDRGNLRVNLGWNFGGTIGRRSNPQ